MCGRYTRDHSWAEVHAFLSGLSLHTPAQDPEPAYNLAPTQQSWVLIAHGDGAEAREMRWGLIPSWAKDAKLAASMINARVETAAVKPAFRAAWKARCCLVPASGYYEWRLENGSKQPYWIHDPTSRVMIFAGLWEHWRGPSGEPIQSFSIITQEASAAMAKLHDRAPLFLPPVVCRDWLAGSPDQAAAIAAAAALPELVWHPVGRAVSNSRNQGAQLVEPVSA